MFSLLICPIATAATPPLIQLTETKLADYFPQTTQGENGIRLQYINEGGDYVDMQNSGNYAFNVPGYNEWNLPLICVIDALTNDVHAHPTAVNQCGLEADDVIRVTLTGSYGTVCVFGRAWNANFGSCRFYIYKGAANRGVPLWEATLELASQTFCLYVPYTEGEDLFFVTDSGDEDEDDHAHWDIRFQGSSGKVYVKPTGDDDNSGYDWDNAKQTVQAGINAASASDEVWVAAGTYNERITLKDGVALYGGFAGTETDLSQRPAFPRADPDANRTTLNGGQAGSVVTVPSGAGADTILDGFTINNGTGTLHDEQIYGGGIFCHGASPRIMNNTITSNTAKYGGGIACMSGGEPYITNNTISSNTVNSYGGGIICYYSTPTIANNIIMSNTTTAGFGAGVYCSTSSASIYNNTIVENTATGAGGGISCETNSNALIANNIVAYNSSGIHASESTPILTDNCVFDNTESAYQSISAGSGDIDLDPLFVDHPGGNYHLSEDSPCIDTGDDSVVQPSDLDMDLQARQFDVSGVGTAQVDMGADEVYKAATPTFSPGSGIYDSMQTVAISCLTSGATIRYTTNGNNPSTTSALYSSPVRIGRTTTLKARAWKTGCYNSAVGLAAYTINNPILYVRSYGSNGHDGFSWAKAKRTVQAAINASVSGDEIWVKYGTYTECITLKDGVKLYGGFAGTETARSQRNWNHYVSILDGNHQGSVVSALADTGLNTEIDGFTIRNGSGTDNRGGGINCMQSSVRISHNIITGNSVTNYGGGIRAYSGSPVINNNIIVNNTATLHGGGIYLELCPADVRDNTITGNSAGSGSGIYSDYSTATIVNNILTDGIYISGNSPTAHHNFTSGDPLFIDVSAGNYHLQPDSPCINAGDDAITDGGDRDMDNQPRILGSHVDIGADELKRPRFDCDGDGCDDLIGRSSSSNIYCSTDLSSWTNIANSMTSKIAVGDLNGDGLDDIIGTNSLNKVRYTTNLSTWTTMPGALWKIAAGDLDGDGASDIAGIGSSKKVYYSTNKTSWTGIIGYLEHITIGDINGDGSDDIVGLSSSGKIYYSANMTAWVNIPGTLSAIAVGDFNGDETDDIAGLNSWGKPYYTLDRGAHWSSINSALIRIAAGDLDGDGKDDLVGLTSSGKVCYSINKTSWVNIPGTLSAIAVGDLDGNGTDDLAGINASGRIYYSTDKTTWTRIIGTLTQIYSAR